MIINADKLSFLERQRFDDIYQTHRHPANHKHQTPQQQQQQKQQQQQAQQQQLPLLPPKAPPVRRAGSRDDVFINTRRGSDGIPLAPPSANVPRQMRPTGDFCTLRRPVNNQGQGGGGGNSRRAVQFADLPPVSKKSGSVSQKEHYPLRQNM